MMTPGMDTANRPNHMLLWSVGGRLWAALYRQALCGKNFVPIECGAKDLCWSTHNADC